MPDRVVLFDRDLVSSTAGSRVVDLGEIEELVVWIHVIEVWDAQGAVRLKAALQHSDDGVTWIDLENPLEFAAGTVDVSVVKSYKSGLLGKFRVTLELEGGAADEEVWAVVTATALLRRPAGFLGLSAFALGGGPGAPAPASNPAPPPLAGPPGPVPPQQIPEPEPTVSPGETLPAGGPETGD